MGSLKIWLRVPDGSDLALAVTADGDTPFVSGARLLDDDGTKATDTLLPQEEISPGPRLIGIRAGRSYSVRVRVAHLSPSGSDIAIAAHIVKPGGPHFGADFEHIVTGRKGDDPQRATIIVVAEATA